MKVAYLLQPRDPFDPAHLGSVSLVTFHLAAGLAERGHRVVLYARRQPGRPAVERLGERLTLHRTPAGAVVWQQVRMVARGLRDAMPPAYLHPAYFPRHLDRLIPELVRARPDVVHVATQAQYLPRLRESLPDSTLLLHLHDELLLHLPAPWVRARLAAADLVICVREGIRHRLARLCPEHAARLRTLDHGADVARFTPASIAAPPARLLFVGRLSPEKGVHVITESFRELHRRRPDARLDLVGSPGLMPYSWIRAVAADPHVATLLRFYGRNSLERVYREVWQRGRGYLGEVRRVLGPAIEAVRFLGHVPHERLPEAYRRASIVVAPSVCDELPAPVFEGMACGLVPVVTYATRGEGVVRPGETVVRVERNDSHALRAALDALIRAPDRMRAISEAARSAMLREGAWTHRAAQLEEHYRRALVAA